MGDWKRALTESEQAWITQARATADTLYAGKTTPHRSCGIAMAETFGRQTPPYQILRRGGLTGLGPCGVLQGARMILGELLGDPNPTGPVTDELRLAMTEFESRVPARLQALKAPTGTRCNDLTAPFATFKSPERADFCTGLTAEIAALLAEVLVRNELRPVSADSTRESRP